MDVPLSTFYYEVVSIYVAATGGYAFSSDSSVKTNVYLYIDDFVPSTPSVNLLFQSIDQERRQPSMFTAYLQVNTKYVFVAASSASIKVMAFSILISGPSTVYFNRKPERARRSAENQLPTTALCSGMLFRGR